MVLGGGLYGFLGGGCGGVGGAHGTDQWKPKEPEPCEVKASRGL